jgi:tyrosine-protein phosphatase SIW14
MHFLGSFVIRFIGLASLLMSFSAGALPSSALAEIVRFRELDPGRIYRGGQPETLTDYALLQKVGIRTIINMKTTEEEIESEARLAEAFGIRMISRPINPVFGLSDEELDEIQSFMMDPRLQPVFIHCRHGKDRTGLMAGVYRVEQQGWTPDAAYSEMRSLGFSPWLVGLRHRFWSRMSERGFFVEAASQN